VAFAVSGEHGRSGTSGNPTVTSGRLFVKNGAINIIFNDIHGEFTDQFLAAGWLRPFEPGSRGKPSQAAVVAKSDATYVANNRRDWILIAESAAPPMPQPIRARPATVAPAVPVTATATSVVSTRTVPASAVEYQKSSRRLAVLKGLKDKGLISETEYNEKRKEISKDL